MYVLRATVSAEMALLSCSRPLEFSVRGCNGRAGGSGERKSPLSLIHISEPTRPY